MRRLLVVEIETAPHLATHIPRPGWAVFRLPQRDWLRHSQSNRWCWVKHPALRKVWDDPDQATEVVEMLQSRYMRTITKGAA